jgi:hypothetical protein
MQLRVWREEEGSLFEEVKLAVQAAKHAPTLVKHWSNAGQTLVKRWSNAGQTLVKCRPPHPLPLPPTAGQTAGQILLEFWMNTGQILVEHV